MVFIGRRGWASVRRPLSNTLTVYHNVGDCQGSFSPLWRIRHFKGGATKLRLSLFKTERLRKILGSIVNVGLEKAETLALKPVVVFPAPVQFILQAGFLRDLREAFSYIP